MQFRIHHATTYKYSRDVFLEPHTIRLHPHANGLQRVVLFDLQITPTPQGISRQVDAEGNSVAHVWFEGLTDRLQIAATSEVELSRTNAFDYLVSRTNAELPVSYSRAERPLLAAAKQRVAVPSRSDPVHDLAQKSLQDSGRKLSKFLMMLCNRIYDGWPVIHREEGNPWPPEQTYERQSGSCRDLAWLFVDACRSVGLASRFVSGYQEGEEAQHRRELHAWAEVYIPDGGWRGFDPTHGLAVSDRHVSVASGITPAAAAPISGSIRGTGASTTLSYEIDLQVSNRALSS